VNVRMAGGSVVHRFYRQPHLRSQQLSPATGRSTLPVASDRLARAHRRWRQAHLGGLPLATGCVTAGVAGDTLILRYYLLDRDEPRRPGTGVGLGPRSQRCWRRGQVR